MPDSARFSWSVRRISPVPPPNSVWKTLAEVGVDGLEGLGEFLARDLVDLLNGLLGVADGIDQVLALRAQEFLALLRFLELFHGRGIHRRPAPRCGRALRWQRCSASAIASASGTGSSAGASSSTGAVQLLAAGLVQDTSARPACAPARLRSASASPGSPAPPRAASSALLRRRAALRAWPASSAAISLTRGFQRARSRRPARRRFRSSSMLSASRRARCSPSRSISGAMALRRPVVSRNCCSSRPMARALAAMALFEAGQLGARGGVLFADRRRLRFPASPAPAARPRAPASRCRAQPLLLLHRGAVAFALLGAISRHRAAAAPAPAAPPKGASWRATDPRPACAFRDRAPRGPFRAPAAAPRSRSSSASRPTISWCSPSRRGHLRRRAPSACLAASTPSSRASRFMASGPAPDFLPPVTVWP